MYCSKCGQPVSTQPFCPNCGTATGLAASPVSGFPSPVNFSYGRVARHLRTLGILWIVFAGYMLLRLLLILPFLHFAFRGDVPWMRSPEPWMYGFHPGGWLIHFIIVMVVVRVILSLAVGIALLTRQPWGRIFAIVIAFLTLLKPVLGTILAIYTLWVLLCRNAGEDYDRLTLSSVVPPPYNPGIPGART